MPTSILPHSYPVTTRDQLLENIEYIFSSPTRGEQLDIAWLKEINWAIVDFLNSEARYDEISQQLFVEVAAHSDIDLHVNEGPRIIIVLSDELNGFTKTLYFFDGVMLRIIPALEGFVEYPSIADFPEVGNNSYIYIDLSNRIGYRWTGSFYIPTATQASTEPKFQYVSPNINGVLNI